MKLIRPDWPAPSIVRAVATTRLGGASKSAWSSLNLGDHVGDVPADVAENRRRLKHALALSTEPLWLQQVHGHRIVDASQTSTPIEADGTIAVAPGSVCVVQTADCLPVLICDRDGQAVAAVHAGWRGLVGGILEAAVAAFVRRDIRPASLLAWLGPAIGPAVYEVGEEVYEAFTIAADRRAFVTNDRGRWQLDLYGLARGRLAALGLRDCYGGDFCTYSDADNFFSYRRDGQCGRQASLIWIQA